MTLPVSPLRAAALFAVSIMFSFCSSSKKATDAPRPAETYLTPTDDQAVSTIAVPVHISMDDLMRSINQQLSASALYEDYSYDDNGHDDLMMNAWKSRDISIFVSGNTLRYRVPVKLWIKKRLFVGEAEANGELALAFKTQYTINPDWSITTNTEVEYHEWLTPPVLKTGIGEIGIETLSSLVLSRSKRTLAQSLDRVVSQQLSLRPYVQEVWNAIQEPTLLSPEYRMWVKTTPTSIGMTPLTVENNTIKSKIAVECLNDVTFGEKPVFRENTLLPNLSILAEAPDDFALTFKTDVPFNEAEQMAKGIMLGQEFTSGKRKVKVEDIKIWGNADKIVVNTRLSGAFNGQIYFMGRPRLNAAKNQIEVADLDFHVDTKNFLMKSASWIFQGPIRKQMAAAMTFPLEENLTSLKTSVQETLNYYEIQPGVVLTGQISEIFVKDTRVTPSGIRVDLFSKGRVNVDVKGL